MAEYREGYRRRLSDVLRSQGLSTSDLVTNKGRPLSAAEIRKSVGSFRVSIVEHQGERVAVANTSGSGSSGKFAVAHIEGGQLMAAKTVRTEVKSHATTAVMELSEVNAEVGYLQRFFDPKVSKLELGKDGKQMILMPLGLSDLDRLVPSMEHLRAEVARSTLVQVSRQLAEIHGEGLLHGDIKPANMIILPDGRVSLIDMASVTTPEKDNSLEMTPRFAAPERLTPNEKIGVKSDMWSLGLTLALIRKPAPRELLVSNKRWNDMFRSSASLQKGIEMARGDVSAPVTDDEAAHQWCSYFRGLRDADPEFAAVVLNHLLVPQQNRASAAELCVMAKDLARPDEANLQEACQQADHAPSRQALRAAFQLRLADEDRIL